MKKPESHVMDSASAPEAKHPTEIEPRPRSTRRRVPTVKIVDIDGTHMRADVTDDSQRSDEEDLMTRSSSPDSAAISVDDFRKYADQASSVAIISHHARLKVIAVGTTPDGRAIAWLDPSIDTARHFMDALDDAFGERAGAQTARELALAPTPGKALPSALIHRAIDMAQTAKIALDGVDFLNDMTRQSTDVLSFLPGIAKPSDPL